MKQGSTGAQVTRGILTASPAAAPQVGESRQTQRGSGEGVLHPSAEPFRELANNAYDILYTHDLDGRFTSMNRTGEQLTGYSLDEIRRLGIEDLVAPESLPTVREMLRRKLEGEERTLYEVELVAKDGSRVAVEVSTAITRRDGVPVGLQGIARDISGRRRAEEALRNSEERFRLLVENSSDGIKLVAPDGIIFYASSPACRILGYPVEEIVGRHVLDFLHPDDRDRMAWQVADCVSKPGVAISAQYRCRHKDGIYRFIESIGVNRLHEPGVGAIVVNFRDVTDRLQTVKALQESEERFRAVFDSALMAIFQLDLEGRVTAANRAALEMTGWSFDELRSRSLEGLVHPEDAHDGQQAFRAMAAGERDSYQVERRYVVKDGRVIWAVLSASLVRDASGRPSFCIALLENISERKRAEAELLDTNKRLSVWVQELEQRTTEISLLSELGDMLQACRSPDEAYDVLAPVATLLFPGASGALSVVSLGQSMLDPVAHWGELGDVRPFSTDDCWAIRRGRPHIVEDSSSGLLCRHTRGLPVRAALCVPLVAHGELLGLLTLLLPEVRGTLDPKRRLAMTVAEHVALALANLRLHETLRSQSIRDPLTSLFNRRYMEESLQREMRRAARSRQPVGIIMIDIDHFKGFNDSYGHEAGDVLLQSVGSILQRSVRAEDIACRYGGEEFALILPEASLVDAAQRAEYVRQAISHLSLQFHRQPLGQITVSAGVAIYPDHGPTGDAVLRAADAALYQAKSRGRNRIVLNRPTGFSDGSLAVGER